MSDFVSGERRCVSKTCSCFSEPERKRVDIETAYTRLLLSEPERKRVDIVLMSTRLRSGSEK